MESKFTTEQIQEMQRLYTEGDNGQKITIKEIADRFNSKPQTITYYLKGKKKKDPYTTNSAELGPTLSRIETNLINNMTNQVHKVFLKAQTALDQAKKADRLNKEITRDAEVAFGALSRLTKKKEAENLDNT